MATHGAEVQKTNPLGIAVSDLTPEIISQFRLQDEKGVMVVGVEPGGKGDEAGVVAVVTSLKKSTTMKWKTWNNI